MQPITVRVRSATKQGNPPLLVLKIWSNALFTQKWAYSDRVCAIAPIRFPGVKGSCAAYITTFSIKNDDMARMMGVYIFNQ